MPNFVSKSFYNSGSSWVSSSGNIPVTFDGAANAGIFVLAQLDSFSLANPTSITSVVLDPGGLNIALTQDASHVSKSGVWMGGVLGSTGDPSFNAYSAKGLTIPAGTYNLVITSTAGSNSKMRARIIVMSDVVSATYAAAVNPVSTGNTVNLAVSSASGRMVLALPMFGSLPDTATLNPNNGGTLQHRVLLTEVGLVPGAIWTYPGAATVTVNGQAVGGASNYTWGVHTWDIQGYTAPALTYTPTVAAQSGTVGTTFGWTGSALSSFFSGGTAPYTYSSTTLPAGLSLNTSTGVVSGTPTAAGTFSVTFTATDAASQTASTGSVTFTIAAAPATAVTLSGPSGGTVGSASSSFTVGANGAITGTVRVTLSDLGGGGSFSVPYVDISAGTPTQTFTYTAASAGNKSISLTNNGGLSNPSAATYAASAVPATITIPGLSAWTGTVQAGLTVAKVAIIRISDIERVLALTNLTANGSGDLTIISASLSAGTAYMVLGFNSDGTLSFRRRVVAA